MAAIFFICLALGTTSTYAAVNVYKQHLSSISQTKLQEINKETQQSTQNADSYSRKLSQNECNRMTELTKKYEGGKMPQKEISIVEKKSEIKNNQFYFCIENSMFYIPTNPLTDEQILEIIDWNHIRNYALQKENKEKTVEPTGEVKEQALNLAKHYANLLFSTDLSSYTSKVVKQKLYQSHPLYVVEFTEKSGKTKIEIGVTLTNQQLVSVHVMAQEEEKYTLIEEERYQKIGGQMKKLANELLDDKLEQMLYSYRYKENNLYNNRVVYYAVTSENKGYTITYDMERKQITGIYQFADFTLEKKQEKEGDEILYKEDKVKSKYGVIKNK